MRKRLATVLGCLLVLTILVGVVIPVTGSAPDVTIEFLNPLGTIEPKVNQPLTDRPGDLNGKTVRLIYYGAANSPSQLTCQALGALLETQYPRVNIIDAGANSLGTVLYDAKTDEQYDTWKTDADAIIFGVVEDNVAAWWIPYHAKQLEARGVPVVVVTNSWFESAVKCGAEDNGFANMRTVSIDRSLFADAYGKAVTGTPNARRTYLDEILTGALCNQVASALTAQPTDLEASTAPLLPAQLGDPGYDTFEISGRDYISLEQKFNNLSMQMEFGDGLPLIIPTRELVDNLLATTDRAPDEVLGKMMPRCGIITVEKVAINAVMAGSRPEHFPIILAALEAYANAWEDNKLFYQALMSNTQNTIVMMVSGPIAKTLKFGSGRVLASTNQEADVILGRAFKLCVRNIGHMLTENSSAIVGLGRFNDHAMFVFGEDVDMLDYIGWETHSELMGFEPDSSTVTLCYSTYARLNAGVGGGAMTGGLPSGAISSIRSAVGTAANAVPSIIIINDSISQMMASDQTQPFQSGGFGTNAQSWMTKAIAQNRLTAANPNANIEKAFWPVVAGEASTSGRVFNGGTAIGLRGFHTQLIAEKGQDTVAPSAPQNVTVVYSDGMTAAALKWSAPDRNDDITGYQVSCTDGVTWIDVGMNTDYKFSVLDPDGQYFFRVRAVNNIKNSADIEGVANNAANPLAVSFKASGRGAWASAKVAITSIKIDASPMVTVSRNSRHQFNVILNDFALADDIVWTVSSATHAGVDADGLVTIKNVMGTATLTAKDPVSGLQHTIILRIT